jgi:hypothetical protein
LRRARRRRPSSDLLIATYKNGDATLTLHAALHVADPEHYRDLQQRFTRSTRCCTSSSPKRVCATPGDGVRRQRPLSLLQGGMARGLGLVEQFVHVDYRRANFVHADLTDEQWKRRSRRPAAASSGNCSASDRRPTRTATRRESAQGGRRRRGAAPPARVHELRIVFARLLAEPDGDRRHPTVIIEARNERCLEVLQQQLAAGKRKLGIYYGAAHMEHIERGC